MSTINATLDIGDDTAGIIEGLLSRFPKGRRVRVAVSDEPSPPEALPTLEEFTARVEAARLKLPNASWKTSDEAMQDLREGERE